MVIGNNIDGHFSPELISIGANKRYSKWTSQKMTFNEIMDSHKYGMVGVVLNEIIYTCGGGQILSNYSTEEYSSTAKCQIFDLESYTWINYISMREERTFAQSMVFKNNSWFIMGGQNFQGFTLDTTDYLDSNATYFVADFTQMPDSFAQHCAKMINTTHLFTTGGKQNLPRPIAKGQFDQDHFNQF